jgi:hypothetical protein
MKKIILILTFFLVFSCKSKPEKNPLIIPPNFAQMPDLNNIQEPSKEETQENVAKLKELLLKSD